MGNHNANVAPGENEFETPDLIHQHEFAQRASVPHWSNGIPRGHRSLELLTDSHCPGVAVVHLHTRLSLTFTHSN